MMTRLTKRLQNGTAVFNDYSIHTQMEAREKLCRLEEDMEAGKLVYIEDRENKKEDEKAENTDRQQDAEEVKVSKQAAGAKGKRSAKKSEE